MKILSIAFTISSLAILIFSFTNCASGLEPVKSSSSSVLAANDIAKSGVLGGSIKTFVSNSMNGPWVENGTACKGQISYFKTTGVDFSKRPKGCASQASSTGCLDLNGHRMFLGSEIIGSNIVTSISVAESNSFPLGAYSFYISTSDPMDPNTTVLKKSGSAQLQNCGGVSPVVCQWTQINPQVVIGGGNVIMPPGACNQQNQGASGIGFYDMGSGNISSQNYQCMCK